MPRFVPPLAVATLLVLAGCAGMGAPTAADGRCEILSPVPTPVLSMSESQISDFEHLNVTITQVDLKRKSAQHNRKWVEKDIENRRIDLAQLNGETLTLLEDTSVPDGTYKKAFLHVTNVSGTLTDGSQADVVLRRDRLKVKKRFDVSGNESIRFVVEPRVAQRDGQYVLKPLIGKSSCR